MWSRRALAECLCLFLLAALLGGGYLRVTGPDTRQHDVKAHREYIKHVCSRYALPDVLQGWETWQPPFYYVLAGGWRSAAGLLSRSDDGFRAVQWLACVLYVVTVGQMAVSLRWLGLPDAERVYAVVLFAILPASLFMSARINNDAPLPLIGLLVCFVTAQFCSTGEKKWLGWLAAFLVIGVATKGSCLAVTLGALVLIFWAEKRRAGWQRALRRAYLTGLPAGIWQLAWCYRSLAQTGNPLYVNTDLLPAEMLIHQPAWRRLLSFDVSAFINGAVYYDESTRNSYPGALLTSLIFGENSMSEYGFAFPVILRCGTLGLALLLAASVFIKPAKELRPIWATCITLVACHAALILAYAIRWPFSCNQDIRFYAPVFAPLSMLCGMGFGHFWRDAGLPGRAAVCVISGALVIGLADFYVQLLI